MIQAVKGELHRQSTKYIISQAHLAVFLPTILSIVSWSRRLSADEALKPKIKNTFFL